VKTHRLDLVSLVLGIGSIIAGIAATNGRLGNLINDRPNWLVPLIILGAGLLAIGVAARRGLHERQAPVDKLGHSASGL
jgi:flagellar motor component MotA